MCDVYETRGHIAAQPDMAKDGGVNSVQLFNMENTSKFCVK